MSSGFQWQADIWNRPGLAFVVHFQKWVCVLQNHTRLFYPYLVLITPWKYHSAKTHGFIVSKERERRNKEHTHTRGKYVEV